MMKRIPRLAAAVLTALMLFLSLPAFSLAEPTVRTAPGTKDYNFGDWLFVYNFLEATDENGIKNGTKLFGDNYDPDDPETWSVDMGDDIPPYGFAYEEVDGEMRLISVACSGHDLTNYLYLFDCTELRTVYCQDNRVEDISVAGCSKLEALRVDGDSFLTGLDVTGCSSLECIECFMCNIGELDLSDCSELRILDMEGNPVGELDVSNCPELWYLMCENCGLSELDVSNNPRLQFLYCGVNDIDALDLSNNERLISLNCDFTDITELDVSGCPMLEELQCVYGKLNGVDMRQNESLVLDEVVSDGRGAVGVNVSGDWMDPMFVDAYPDAGEAFLGWYNESGEQVSTDQRLYFTEDDGTVFIARFTGADEPGPGPEPTPVIGDVDGDGEIALADALLAMRCALGLMELTPEQIEAADVNGDGEVTLVDALIILRAALGI